MIGLVYCYWTVCTRNSGKACAIFASWDKDIVNLLQMAVMHWSMQLATLGQFATIIELIVSEKSTK